MILGGTVLQVVEAVDAVERTTAAVENWRQEERKEKGDQAQFGNTIFIRSLGTR